MTFSPFQNEADAVEIGSLKIENRVDQVSIYGTLALTKDRAGLANAKVLKELVDQIVAALEQQHDLPVLAAAAIPPKIVKNPFARS